MAISNDLPGIEVAVTVDGIDLKEYVDEELEEDARTTTRYIEAVSGQTFEVQIKVTKGFWFAGDSLSCRIRIDGHWAGSPLILEKQCVLRDYMKINTGARVSSTEVRKYQFAPLETASDGRMLLGEADRVKGLGTIKVSLRHQKKRCIIADPVWSGSIADGVVSEKALNGQALSHRVQLTRPQRKEKYEMWETEIIPGFLDPLATFVFKYRSLDKLKVERLIPRTPTPPPLEERDPATLTFDELRELQRRLIEFRDERESKIKIKREHREGESRRRKIARPSAGSTQLELDDEGGVRASSTPTIGEERKVIEID